MKYLVTNQTFVDNTIWEKEGIYLSTINNMLHYFESHKEIEFDTETTGFDPHLDTILFSQYGDSKNQFVVDHSTVSIKEIFPLFFKEDITWILQNAKFDLKFLYKQGIYLEKIYDTYIAESVLYLGDKTHRKSLADLCKRYLDIELDKSVRKDLAKMGLTTRVVLYSAYDVAYLSLIKEIQLKIAEKEDLETAIRFENAFVKVLAYIEYCGFKLDIDLWKKKIIQNKTEVKNLLSELDKWIIENNFTEYINNQLDLFSTEIKTNINWASPKQVLALFKKLGINVIDKHGKESVDAKVIASQKNKSSLISIYLKYKAADKVLSTYGYSFLELVNPATKRLHTSFNQLMDTSRLSSGGNNTINFQNIPAIPEFKEESKIYERECFIPEKGNTFIVSDYSGQESVIFANKTLDPGLLNFYDNGYADMHSYVAKLCYPEHLSEVPLEQVKKARKDLRQNAKAAGFALQFGGVGMTIAANLGISIEEGCKVEKAYFDAFPGVKDYFDKVSKEVVETGIIVYNSEIGHKRKFTQFKGFKELEKKIKEKGFWDTYKDEKNKNSSLFQDKLKPMVSEYFKTKGVMERTAKNAPVQGTAAAMTKLALLKIFRKIKNQNLLGKVLIPNVIHDEIVLEVPVGTEEFWAKVVKDSMEEAGTYFCTRVPLTADPYIGPDWTH
jgi:DNA polymerase I-like protein with 3'-5' exonuclease and polymerase domains